MLSFLLAIAFANFMPKETYGIYRYVISLVGVFGVSSLQGMGMAVIQAAARGQDGIILPALKTKIKFGLIGSLASFGLAAYYALQNNLTLALSFIIVAGSVPFLNSLAIYISFLEGKKLFKKIATYEAIGQTIVSISLIIGLLITNNLLVILTIFLSSWILVRFIFLKQTLKAFPSKPDNFDPETISYGKHVSIPGILATLFGSIDNIILFHFLGAAQLAIYSFALAPVNQLQNIATKMITLATPKLVNRSIEEINSIIRKRSVGLILIGSITVTAYILVADSFFSLFFDDYLASIRFSQIFSLVLALNVSQVILSSALNAKLTQIPKKLLYLWNIPGLVLTVSMLILVEPFGIMGAVTGRIISTISTVIVGIILWGVVNKLAKKSQ